MNLGTSTKSTFVSVFMIRGLRGECSKSLCCLNGEDIEQMYSKHLSV